MVVDEKNIVIWRENVCASENTVKIQIFLSRLVFRRNIAEFFFSK